MKTMTVDDVKQAAIGELGSLRSECIYQSNCLPLLDAIHSRYLRAITNGEYQQPKPHSSVIGWGTSDGNEYNIGINVDFNRNPAYHVWFEGNEYYMKLNTSDRLEFISDVPVALKKLEFGLFENIAAVLIAENLTC